MVGLVELILHIEPTGILIVGDSVDEAFVFIGGW